MSNDSKDAAATWDERAASWDDQAEAHVYASQAFETLEPVVRQHLGAFDELRVLDFGAGTGLLTAKLAPLCRDVVAVDIAPKMIEMLAAKSAREGWSNVAVHTGELEQLVGSGEVQGAFDLVVASSVCSFLPDFTSSLSLLRSLLRPGGLFVQWDWHGATAGDWAKGFTREQVAAAYETAELAPLSIGLGFIFHFDGNELEVLMGVGRR